MGEYIAVAVLFTVVSVVAVFQQHVRILRYMDSDEYYWMAYKFHIAAPMDQSAPWVYRIATPWLASFASEGRIAAGTPFTIINVASSLAIALLLVDWLRRFVDSAPARLAMIALFLTEWHGPARFVHYHPMYVDPLFMVFLLVGCLVIERTRNEAVDRAAPWLMLVSFLGALSRETMVLVPLAFVCARIGGVVRGGRSRLGHAVWTVAPLASSMLGLWITHRIGIPSEPYSATAIPLEMLTQKPLFTWLLGWFFTFGPAVIVLIGVDLRRGVRWLSDRPDLAFLLGSVGLLGFIGGTDTERILIWAFPVVYALAGRAIDRHAALAHGGVATVLVLAQAVSARVFWQIPSPSYNPQLFSSLPSWRAQVYTALNRLIVIDNDAGNLWSFWGSRRWHAVLLAYDVVFVGVMLWWAGSLSGRREGLPAKGR